MIKNGNFNMGAAGAIPENWAFRSLYSNLDPVFKLSSFEGKPVLEVRGNGNANCIGHLFTPVSLKRGETYIMKVLFHISPDVNPQQHLLFTCCSASNFSDFNNGIFKFKKLRDNWVSGESTFCLPGEGELDGEVRITYRLNPGGTVHISEISLEKTEAIPARPVKVACGSGSPAPGTWKEAWTAVFDKISGRSTDIFLLPEIFNDCLIETDGGPAMLFMAEQAKRHSMYLAGNTLYKDPADGCVYNSTFLFDREGKKIGRYDKNHPFSNEMVNMGVSPGREVPVFDTDFGRIGILCCYDSWFTDVAELLALKGAEIILFPNAGYYRALMPARAADNCVRIICSSLSYDCGIWDTSGADVCCPDLDPTRRSNCNTTFNDVLVEHVGVIKMLSAVLDLNQSPSPHNWGGPMMSAPGGRRNRRDQHKLLTGEIQKELERWWEEQ